ncbi:MAG: nuclear transport factor 2 family protein [Holophaga sp.]|nr:nuclear transport factor 2 family protein [Holophaga sp.]
MQRLLPILFAATLVAQAPMPEEAARKAILATALDYIEGWYDGDVARMERALHPDLAKRAVRPTPEGKTQLDHMGAAKLIAFTRAAYGKQTPKDKQRKEVQILDVYGNAATVKVIATDWVDYLHLAHLGGKWVIVNVLWELNPRPTKQN